MRSITVLSRREFTTAMFATPVAVISIVDLLAEHPPCCSPGQIVGRLNLRFHDFDPEALEREAEEYRDRFCGTPELRAEDAAWRKSTIANCMSPNQAALITQFARDTLEHPLVVHCEAGISRSAGVAAALHIRELGVWLQLNTRFHPNPWVRKLVLEAP